MSSALLASALASLQQNDYTSLAILTAVGYDYILTFSDEIEYIWTKPWTSVSTAFIFVRYAGLYTLAVGSLGGSTFIPGPAKMYVFVLSPLPALGKMTNAFEIVMVSQGEIIYAITEWTFLLFLGSADFVMLLRMWALYNQSRVVFRTLLAIFTLEILGVSVAAAVYSDSKYMSSSTTEILDFSFCVRKRTFPILTKGVAVLELINSAALSILATIQFLIQSFQMYRATKQWKLNRYINLLVGQGVLYFFPIFVGGLLNFLSLSGTSLLGGWEYVLPIVDFVPLYTLTPRFILSIRALYANDVQGRRGEGIDSGFGLSLGHGDAETALVFTRADRSVGLNDDVETGRHGRGGIELPSSACGGAVRTAVVSADVERNNGLDSIEEVPRDFGATE